MSGTVPAPSSCTALVPLAKPSTSLVPLRSSVAPHRRQNEIARLGEDLDAVKPFSLGVRTDDLPCLHSLAQDQPELANMIEHLVGKVGSAGTIRLDRAHIMRSDQYAKYALRQMMAKYGKERVEKLLETLNNQTISGALSHYAFELTPSHVRDGAEINRRLANLAVLLEPENLEKLERLLLLLSEEGATSPLPISAMQLDYINSLLESREERNAEIELQKLSRQSLRPALWMNAHREYQNPLNFAPAERLHAFLQWNSQAAI